MSLSQAVQMLPTPVAQPSGNSPEAHLRKKPGRAQVTDLAILVEHGLLATGGLLPTPQATNATASSAGYGANLHEVSRGMEAGTFGVYEQAIARWESVLGRPAPAPTVPPTREGGASTPLNEVRRMAHGSARRSRNRRGSRAPARAAAQTPRKRRRPAARRCCYLPAHQDRH